MHLLVVLVRVSIAWRQGEGRNRDTVLEPTVMDSRGPDSIVPKWNSICSRLDNLLYVPFWGHSSIFVTMTTPEPGAVSTSPSQCNHISV